MNPYDFVRINWERPPQRKSPQTHEVFRGLAGSMHGRITALTPLFLPDKRSGDNPKEFLRNSGRSPILPGSSLKGLFRGMVELAGPGCWWLYGGRYEKNSVDYSNLLPLGFRQCQDPGNLCPACRLFGMLSGRNGSLLGKVCCEEAVCLEEKAHEPLYTIILDGPKPRHRAWYLREGQVAGRKLYFHQAGIQALREFRTSREGVRLNQRIRPLDRGTTFSFGITFTNLEPEVEWPLLLFAVCLQEGMAHKFGYAKPAGFGSIQVQLDRIRLMDLANRYTSKSEPRILEGEDLHRFVQEQTAKVASRIDPSTLADLKRIWKWPPPPGVEYRYPGQTWFKENPNAPLSESLKA